ncbi:hypothetical protein H7J06_18280 [Mycobacterium hodleri]|uniref:hypothetical protein n=1 Tax=Mycolicibacterium hodleri TaxID=49897 RepID=UPI0021F326A9|nr:hypothetical protein [Mycolicibacterium hodleri]MCV7134932.1 hypothetical protein [Mycolicibacterium hodleri]
MSPTDAAASDTKRSMQDKLDSDPDLSQLKLKVVDVVLVNKSGNDYKGIATVKTPIGKEHDVAVDVTADGSHLIWEAAPGAFLFALQEQSETPPPAAAAPPAPSGPQALAPSRDGMVFIVTKSGKTYCQISASEVDCQAPFAFHTPMAGGCPANGLRFSSGGSLEWVCGDLGDIPVVSIGYNTYRALSWIIDAGPAGTTFTNQSTGRSAFISIDSVRVN